MPRIEILREKEGESGWTFRLRVGRRESEPTTHNLHLAWADYNHWSADGGDPPHAVAKAVVRFLLERLDADEMPANFDAAMVRRRFPGADTEIPKLIRP